MLDQDTFQRARQGVFVRSDVIRDNVIATRFSSGESMASIGRSLGITRERVRQIVKRLGVEKDPDVYLEKHGCTLGQYEEIRKREPNAAKLFREQRRSARHRGIGWEISFYEWFIFWQESGKWEMRGRGEYVMCREGDSGPYKLGNIRIGTASENALEYMARRWNRPELDKRHNHLNGVLS